MVAAVRVLPLLVSRIATGGEPVQAVVGAALGGYILNPQTAADQGLPTPEVLYVDPVFPAGLGVTATCVAIQPGAKFKIPDNFVGVISVNAVSSGHRFAGVAVRPPPPVYQPIGNFPPGGPTTVLGGLPSYLYQQYNDDEDLQAFVDAYNQLAQAYVAWFANASLPVYAGNPLITGALLDWVAAGIYGMKRPVLPSGLSSTLGPFNTAAFNTIPFNALIRQGPTGLYATSDDIFKRILTWHLWRGDGFVFNVRWLKRRVQRFLTGTNGTPGQTDQTYEVSVTFGTGNQININLQTTRRFATKGATFNTGAFNTAPFNDLQTTSLALPVSPYVPIFKAAIQAGVLELPFQYSFIVNTN